MKMIFEAIQDWISDYQWVVLVVALILGYLLYRLTRWALARVLYRIALRTESVYDDLIVDQLHPFRFAWLVPLGLIYGLFYATVGPDSVISNILLLLIILFVVDLVLALLNGFNDVYQQRPTYTGASIAAYVDVIKVLIIVGAIFFILAIFTDTPPVALLAGLGAWLAVLLLIFRDTILNFLASIQLSSQELIKDGDWIEVPSFGVNGIVSDVSLNSIKVQNFDNTLTAIPTYKLVEVPYKNWRSMEESGGRRIVLTMALDIGSVAFCDMVVLEKLGENELIADIVGEKISELKKLELDSAGPVDFSLDGPQITNVQLFMEYIEAYLRSRKDIRQRRFTFIIRVLEPGSAGLPIQIFVFTKKIPWAEFEATKGEILMHLIAAAPYFGLKIFQEPTGTDFRAITDRAH
ncbi:mechanosensitive ion channel family protein [Chloroflexota bacterium]